jgi:hypothetical protein
VVYRSAFQLLAQVTFEPGPPKFFVYLASRYRTPRLPCACGVSIAGDDDGAAEAVGTRLGDKLALDVDWLTSLDGMRKLVVSEVGACTVVVLCSVMTTVAIVTVDQLVDDVCIGVETV